MNPSLFFPGDQVIVGSKRWDVTGISHNSFSVLDRQFVILGLGGASHREAYAANATMTAPGKARDYVANKHACVPYLSDLIEITHGVYEGEQVRVDCIFNPDDLMYRGERQGIATKLRELRTAQAQLPIPQQALDVLVVDILGTANELGESLSDTQARDIGIGVLRKKHFEEKAYMDAESRLVKQLTATVPYTHFTVVSQCVLNRL